MLDYTRNPQDSPYIWCTKCKELVRIEMSANRMNTGFKAVPQGVFPLGECCKHHSVGHTTRDKAVSFVVA